MLLNDFGFEVGLTDRQREALQHRADGLTHRQTAKAMGVTTASVDDHVERIKQRLGAKTLHHAIAIGIRRKIIR